MTRIKIVTDSTVDLSQEMIQKYGVDIEVIPLSFTIDGISYQDGVDISPAQFIDKMKQTEMLPLSSQPSVGTFVELYDRLGAEGFCVLSIHMTGGMSGTYHAAQMAAAMSETSVTVIDSEFISKGLGFQVIEAAIMARNGRVMEDIVSHLCEVRQNTRLFVAVDTFDNLVKGGRIGRAKSLVGSLLNIKPIASLREGRYTPVANMRSQAQVVKYLVMQLLDDTKGKTIKGVGIAHAEGHKLAANLKAVIQEKTGFGQVEIDYTSPIISTHTGVGAIGFTYYFE